MSGKQQGNEDGFYGCFAAIRASLDYSYHKLYNRERQLMQDDILRSFLAQGRRSTEQVAIFTAGPMGSGKTFVMDHLKRRGFLPAQDFVTVDPDALRECLPEYNALLNDDALTAGSMTQEEAGLLAEILTHAALGCGMSVIVDGSLRNSTWYENHFSELRDRYANLWLSIIFVTAPRGEIYRRVLVRLANFCSLCEHV